jgi:glutathione synthase/RimK-type ligase-like ATP-grasp enzyme
MYLRLDTDLLHEDSLSLDPVTPSLDVRNPQGSFRLHAFNLTGVLFRAPTHLSESGGERYAPEEQLSRHQWAAFTRALTVFEDVAWVNHPVRTFAAENKPFQLRIARKLGWDVLPTRVTNDVPPGDWDAPNADLAMKALDTFFIRLDDHDVFFYTRAVSRSDLSYEKLRAMPVVLQRYAADKLDVRVTVVGSHCIAASIHHGGAGVQGDWRLQKDAIDYQVHPLPRDVELRCVALVRALGLVFGAVDLVYLDDCYYFLEVNPTGEWAWLTERLGFPIPALLADALSGHGSPTA